MIQSVQHSLATYWHDVLIHLASTYPQIHARMQVYLQYAREYGCALTEKQVLQNFRRAFSSPWTESLHRYVGDGRPFW